MTRFDVAALVWAILLCLALGGAGPGLVAVLMFHGLLALAVFVPALLKGIAETFVAQRGNRR